LSSAPATHARELRTRDTRARARELARTATLGVLARLPRARAQGLRIVHYHHVFDDERPGFARQLDLFQSELEPVSLGEALHRLQQRSLNGRELVVTFDDGFRNQLTNAATMLAEREMSACFFLISDLVGAPADRVEAVCRERLHLDRPVQPMDWDDARRLVELGHEVGSHTRSHPDLTSVSPAELAEELESSREAIDRGLGQRVGHFSAPYGDRARFTEAISTAARSAGYATCLSALRGVNGPDADPYALRRDHLVATWPLRQTRYFLRL
jgi:peptidoglycan/xylan/chitin deacetylase (PgdA/CDA1 family)